MDSIQPPAQRILLAKVGLDGHDRGVKVVARGLRDAGFHVIYSGLWQPSEAVVQAVLDEDADWLGVSLLSGAHMTLVPRLMELLWENKLEDVGVIVGGIIPETDVAPLREMGVAAVFGPGTPIPQIVEFLHQHRPSTATAETDDVLRLFRERDRRALARALTRASRGELDSSLSTPGAQAASRVIAFSGSGGVGKSSLIGRLIERLRQHGETVAVLACDPQSVLTGGALLGDRVRMARPAADPGVFIRSLATPGGRQAIAAHLDAMIQVLQAYGFQTVILETVGAGQGDTAVHSLADVLVVLVQPQTGDELQWEKAGLLEVADVVVVHKSDLPGAEAVAAQLQEQLNPPGGRRVPVLLASSHRGEGVDELWNAIHEAAR